MSKKYQLLDSGDFYKLEDVGGVIVSRPSPQAVWPKSLGESVWKSADAMFSRFSSGEGEWRFKKKGVLPQQWPVQIDGTTFVASLTDFGHIGIFPEQKRNWLKLHEICQDMMKKQGSARILNLFAYTGGSTLACARAGAEVVHCDASKTSVAWARENAAASQLAEAKIRWIIDDVQAFVAREIRREKQYDGIILDPPSYGRGTGGEVWKIEEHLCPLLQNLQKLMSPQFRFILLSAHSQGFSPFSLQNLLLHYFGSAKGETFPDEMVIDAPEAKRGLPSGASCFFIRSS